MTTMAVAVASAGYVGLAPAERCTTPRCHAKGTVVLVAACCHRTVTLCDTHFDATTPIPARCRCRPRSSTRERWIVCDKGLLPSSTGPL